MENKVIARQYQSASPDDFNDVQTYADEAHAHLVADAITTESQFVGLVVSANSSTELAISAGRLYVGSTGQVYAQDTGITQSIFSNLPVSDDKWLAISAIGQTEESQFEQRDFLVDLQTREVEPQTVAMLTSDVVVIHVASGLESPTPERPEPPTGYTLLAHVLLSPAGIQSIELATSRALPNLHAVNQRLVTAEGWITATEPRLTTLVTDMAGLAADLDGRATLDQLVQMANDLAALKEDLGRPDDYSFYGADHFLDEDESDTEATGYSALIDEGIRPAFVATATAALDLLNPLDPGVVATNGFVLPAFTEIKRLGIETLAGTITINQYQYAVRDYVRRTMTRARWRYGLQRLASASAAWWRSGRFNPAVGILQRVGETFVPDAYRFETRHLIRRSARYWRDRYDIPYWTMLTTAHQVSASMLAQTWLSAQTGWLTSVELYFGAVAADGAVTVMLCEAPFGRPNLDAVVADATLQQSALEEGWNKITWTRPAYVDAGTRYAVVVLSGGAHTLGWAVGTAYTQGQLIYNQDGAWYEIGTDRDLMLRLNYAQFASPVAEVQLDPLSLTGGIGDIDIRLEGFVPPGCELRWEYQVSGAWIPIDELTTPQLGGTLLPLRMVMVGTQDLAPGVLLTDSEATVGRFGTALEHWSTERTPSAATSDVRVRLLVEGYNATYHTISVALDVNGTPEAADSTTVREFEPGRAWVEARFTPAAISAYQIKIVASTSDAAYPLHIAERYDVAL